MPERGTLASRVYIAQGEQQTSADPRAVISTILGSCVAVCLHDPEQKIGGMNHILVPDGPERDLGVRGAGAVAMERLVNELMKLGARRKNLEAKVFGGASIVEGLSDVGARNVTFVLGYLKDENISCLAQSVGGHAARQIRFWPASGRVQQRIVRECMMPEADPRPLSGANGMELL